MEKPNRKALDGLQITIQDPQRIYSYANENQNRLFLIGNSKKRRDPITKIDVYTSIDTQKGIFQANIFSVKDHNFSQQFLEKASSSLEEIYSIYQEDGFIYILDSQNLPNYRLSVQQKNIEVLAPEGNKIREYSCIDDFIVATRDFADVLKHTADSLCFAFNKPAPKYSLFFKPLIVENPTPKNQTIRKKNQVSQIEKFKVTSKTTLDDVIGHDGAKKALRDFMIESEYLLKWGVDSLEGGIMLYGPPGCGKTLLAKAIAGELNRPMYSVKLADFISEYFGKAERTLNEILTGVDKEKGILFLDEFEAIVPKRDGFHQQERIISTVLENLDGFSKSSSSVIAATNRLDMIDEAVLRPPRFRHLIEVGLPSDKDKINLYLSKFEEAEVIADRNLLSEDIDFTKLATLSRKFSGAEIEEVVRGVLIKKSRLERDGTNPPLVSEFDIQNEINHISKTRSSLLSGRELVK